MIYRGRAEGFLTWCKGDFDREAPQEGLNGKALQGRLDREAPKEGLDGKKGDSAHKEGSYDSVVTVVK